MERFAGGEVEHRPRRRGRRSDGDQLELPPAVGIAVALLVSTVEGLRETGLNRHRQLEGLAEIAEISVAFGWEIGHLLERSHVRDDVVAPLFTRDQPERREDPGGRGYEDSPDLELVGERAGVQRACPSKGDQGEIARVVAALDRDHAKRPQHLGVDDLERLGGVDALERPGGRLCVELDVPCEHPRQPAE